MNSPSSVAELTEESQTLERTGAIAAALLRAQQALEQARAVGSASDVASALNCVALVHFRMGHYEQARERAREALTQASEETLPGVDALLMLGVCASETSDLSAGEDLYLRAIDLSRQLGYHRALVRGHLDLAAGVYMPRGQFELSLAADAEALRLAKEHNVGDLIWSSLFMTAWVQWLTGRWQQAAETLDELHHVVLPRSGQEGYYCCARGFLALDCGDLGSAPSHFARARSIAETTGEPSVAILVRLGLCRYHRALGDAGTARAWANDAVTLATRVEYRHFLGMSLIERGRAAWKCHDERSAETDLRGAIDILSALDAKFDLARACFYLAAMIHEGTRSDAKSAWKQAARLILEADYAFFLEQERALAFPLIATFLNDSDPEAALLANALVSQLKRVPPLPLHVVTLGCFQVRQRSYEIPDHAWRGRRAGELLRLLLVSPNDSLSREEVIDAFWRDKPPASAQALFHQATSALRRVLEPELPDKFPSRYLEIEDGRVTLHLPCGSQVDFQEFEREIQAEHWDAALTLYQGELFPMDRFADWAAAPRERMRRKYLRALLVLAHRHNQAGRHHEALDLCRRILEIEPWQEDAVLIGMRACLAFQDRAQALRLYKDLERSLREDLGTTPQASLRELHQSLLWNQSPFCQSSVSPPCYEESESDSPRPLDGGGG